MVADIATIFHWPPSVTDVMPLSDMFGDLSAQLNNLQDTATSALSDISKTVGGLLS
ncbi:GpE family phage tail protein [Escherichia coli]|uniref:GpE family phage tail protein n=1 Tax=Escherichia coli TaxID=562 RepID=UPI001CBD4596